MCGSPSSSAPPSSSGSSGPSGPPSPPGRPGGRLDLRRFALALLAAWLLCWPLWLAASPAYERLLAGTANRILALEGRRSASQRVALEGGEFAVHPRRGAPSSGVRFDAGSVHFNWLILIPLLLATRSLGRGVPGPAGAAAALAALVVLHLVFLLAVAEYRSLRLENAHPGLRELLRGFSFFYYAVGRIGLAVLIWLPAGLGALGRRGKAGG